MNIKRSYLHVVAAKATIFPYAEAIEWIISHTDSHNCMVNDDRGNCIGVFQPLEVDKYYKFPTQEVLLNTTFVKKFYGKQDLTKIINGWWKEHKDFFHMTFGWYNIVELR